MEIELVPCYSDKALFIRLAKDYIKTLRTFDSSIRWDEKTWEDMIWYAEFILEDRTIQGFVITEEVRFQVVSDLWYIAEFYIVPEARRKGLGLEAVKKIVSKWHGDVFLYVLKRNHVASLFWQSVEDKLGWKRNDRPEIRQERGCELRVFSQECCKNR